MTFTLWGLRTDSPHSYPKNYPCRAEGTDNGERGGPVPIPSGRAGNGERSYFHEVPRLTRHSIL